MRVALRAEQPDELSMVIPSVEKLDAHSAVHPQAGLPAWPDSNKSHNENPMLPSANLRTGTTMEELHFSPGGTGSGTPWVLGSEADAGVYSGCSPLTVNRGLHLPDTQSAVAKMESNLVFA